MYFWSLFIFIRIWKSQIIKLINSSYSRMSESQAMLPSQDPESVPASSLKLDSSDICTKSTAHLKKVVKVASRPKLKESITDQELDPS